jgi:CheY-like chemotaxis protein
MNDVSLLSLNTEDRTIAAGYDLVLATQADPYEASDMGLINVLRAELHERRILLVDDEILGTTMRAEVLRQDGYSLDVYHSPLEALCCDVSIFDLAIVDFEMPELNGKDLLLRLRALGARFPIVLLTGRLEALLHEDRALFARCIDKGMPIRRLLDVVTELLDQNAVPDCGWREQHGATP